ncbi:MAG: hypothetical protein IIY12_01610, partial [Clostridia bacterium]|nr:hypothetical protein [Clostridia bacterium]
THKKGIVLGCPDNGKPAMDRAGFSACKNRGSTPDSPELALNPTLRKKKIQVFRLGFWQGH